MFIWYQNRETLELFCQQNIGIIELALGLSSLKIFSFYQIPKYKASTLKSNQSLITHYISVIHCWCLEKKNMSYQIKRQENLKWKFNCPKISSATNVFCNGHIAQVIIGEQIQMVLNVWDVEPKNISELVQISKCID